MSDNENQNPGKRPRHSRSIEELQKIIENKNVEIDNLNKKFEYAIEENNRLRKKFEELIKKINNEETSEELTSDEEMLIEEGSNSDNEVEHIAVVESVENQQNDVSESAVVNEAVKMVPRQEKIVSGEPGCCQDKPGFVFKEAVKMVPNQNITKKDVPGASQKRQQENKTTKVASRCKSVPIVTAYNINVKNISNELNRILGHEEYNIKILSKYITNIGVCTLEDYEKLKAMLREKGVDYYTYTPRSQRPFTVVVKGLSDSFDNNEVLEYMQGLRINIRILGLHKLGGDKWLFQMSRDSDLKGFRDIRYILHCRVSMLKHSRRDVIQCYNCQRFGHVAINCNMPYRCVKCSGDHGPGKCVIPPKGENTAEVVSTDPVTGQAIRKLGFPIRCANCGVEGHTASARECPKRQELVRKIAARKNEKGTGQMISTVPMTGRVNGISYATAARAGATESNSVATVSLTSAKAEFDIIDGDCRRLLGVGLLSCLGKLKGFAREYRLLSNDEEKSRALLGMLISLQHDG